MACGAKIVRDLAHIDDPLIGALLVSAFQLTAGMGQILGRFTSSFTSVTIGVSVVCTGQLGMAAAASSGMAIFFSLACAVAGVGYGVAFEGANSLVSSIARLESRSWLASKFYIYGYIFGNVVPSLATGLLTDVFGLLTALSSFTAVVAGMSVVCLILVRRAAKCTS
jgi:MFS family permease